MANLHSRIRAHFRHINLWKKCKNPAAVSDLAEFFEMNPFPQDVKQTYLIRQCVFIALYCLKNFRLDNYVLDLSVSYCREYLHRTERYDNPECKKNRAVFLAAAGDFLRVLAKNSSQIDHKLEHLLSAFDFFTESVEISRSINDNAYVGYQLGNRGDIANHLSSLSPDVKKWLLLAGEDRAESAKILEPINPIHSAHQHVYAADYKFKASKIVGSVEQRKLVIEAIEQGVAALKKMPDNYKLCCSLAIYCENLFFLTDDKSHYVNACNYYKRALRVDDNIMRMFVRHKLKDLKKLYKQKD